MLRRVRIAVQLASLALFLYLLARTVGIGEDQLGPPVRIFLEIDPLIGITTWLRTGALHGLLPLSLATLALAFLLGRSFCGWICPLGTLSQASGRLRRPRATEKTADRYRPSQRWKVWILLAVLASSAAGFLVTGILDPITILVRSLALGLGPAMESTIRAGANGLAATPAGGVTDRVYFYIRDHAMAPHPPRFEQGMLLTGILILLLGLAWIRKRFWCRTLCPLGALLGICAHAGTLRLRQDDVTCTSCALCTFHCQGAADPHKPGGWRASECFVCGNCTAACTRNGLSFTIGSPRIARTLGGWIPRRRAPARRPHPAGAVLDIGRRQLLLAGGIGLAAGALAPLSPSRAHPRDGVIRPPGAGPEPEFLDQCIRCGECMKVCTGNGLHPAALEEGLQGLWAPILRPRLGYCEYECTLCGQVCPTGAIPLLDAAEKKRTVIGIAYVDAGRCLPFASLAPCIVCEEHCPTSPKAIQLDDIEAARPGGERVRLRRPRVVTEACVGCGICEFRCPIEGSAGIRISGSARTDRLAPAAQG